MKVNKLLVLCLIMCVLCSCSKEAKFGLEQFVSRMNSEFEFNMQTSDFMLGKKDNGEQYLLCEENSRLITLSLDNTNNITGVSLMLTDNKDIENGFDYFIKMCAIFTGDTTENIIKSLSDNEISATKINFADSNIRVTVGKWKYVVVCNDYSVTLFCDRV